MKRQATIALLPNVLGGMSGTNVILYTAHQWATISDICAVEDRTFIIRDSTGGWCA